MVPDKGFLRGTHGLVVGETSERAIAAGCARACRASGAWPCVTCRSDTAKPHAAPVAEAAGAARIPLHDVTDPARIDARRGRRDVLRHAIALCPREDLLDRGVDGSPDGVAMAMEMPVHSLIRLARNAEPLVDGGGAMAACPVSDVARAVGGTTCHVDGGPHVL